MDKFQKVMIPALLTVGALDVVSVAVRHSHDAAQKAAAEAKAAQTAAAAAAPLKNQAYAAAIQSGQLRVDLNGNVLPATCVPAADKETCSIQLTKQDFEKAEKTQVDQNFAAASQGIIK